jgi:transglutaminase-like putative cysteine protease
MKMEVPHAYLAATDVVDWRDSRVRELAGRLAAGQADSIAVARRCFEWVRDEIAHCMDAGAQQLVCSASEVLSAGQGYCFAKSHLLAALLRANGIPAGFDYQRLRDQDRFMLHGLNTVCLPVFGWYRLDARGNKPGVDARFSPPQECLAWAVEQPGEVDYGLNLAEPLPEVVSVLRSPISVAEAWERLPSKVRMG